jgi:hypothetical protein
MASWEFQHMHAARRLLSGRAEPLSKAKATGKKT